MGGRPKKVIVINSSPWFAEAGELIDRSEQGSHDELTWIENQIRTGHLLLYRVEQGGELIGIFTAFVDTAYNGNQDLVVVHAVSVSQQPTPYIVTLDPLISSLAKRSGFSRWRVHSQRPGISRRLEQHGFKVSEIVYFKEVN